MNVTIYKKATDVSNGFTKDVFFCLERIKQGKSKEMVEQLRLMPKEEYDKSKSKLPGVCFNGVFEYRSLTGIKEHSGLIILDFDKFQSNQDAINFRDSISDDEFIFATWISPSGKGVKALVKIPASIENHKEYFKALKNYFNHSNWDDSGSDVSRFCFESYDPDLYLNKESKLWDTIEAPDLVDVGSYEVSIAVKSDNIIIHQPELVMAIF
jgi:hypothetical protein